MLSEEEKKAIERLNEILKEYEEIVNIEDKTEREIEMSLYMEDMPFAEIKTVLNLITKLQKENEEKDKQIDLMVEWIEKHTKYYDEDGCYCEVEKEICKYDIECKDCIKQYFERKIEDVES